MYKEYNVGHCFRWPFQNGLDLQKFTSLDSTKKNHFCKSNPFWEGHRKQSPTLYSLYICLLSEIVLMWHFFYRIYSSTKTWHMTRGFQMESGNNMKVTWWDSKAIEIIFYGKESSDLLKFCQTRNSFQFSKLSKYNTGNLSCSILTATQPKSSGLSHRALLHQIAL